MAYLNVPWSSFEKAITKNVSSVSSALIILLLIGALGGTWMISGVVPTLIYYGMHIISPDAFPRLVMRHLCPCQRDDRIVMDHHRHHWHRADGHRKGTGLRGRLGGWRHHLRRLLRRQDFAALRHYHDVVRCAWRAAVQPHPLHAHNDGAVHRPHPHHLHRGRLFLPGIAVH